MTMKENTENAYEDFQMSRSSSDAVTRNVSKEKNRQYRTLDVWWMIFYIGTINLYLVLTAFDLWWGFCDELFVLNCV